MVRKSKKAFTLIELIFAIVIIAISVMSLPMMARVNAKGMENNLVQEAIFASVAEINMATTYIWDDNSLLVATGIDDVSRVINTNTGVNDCVDTGVDDAQGDSIIRRSGHIKRRCLANNNTIVSKAQNGISLEVPAHDYKEVFIGAGNSQSAYKQDYKSELVVNYCGDGTCDERFGYAATTTDDSPNLKEIVVTIKNEDNQTVTLLRAYSANVGEVNYEKRRL